MPRAEGADIAIIDRLAGLIRRPWLQTALVLAILLGIFGQIADEVIEGDTLGFDHAVTMMLRDNGDIRDPIGPPWLEEAGRDLTGLGSFAVLSLVVAVVAGFLLLVRQYRAALFVTLAVISGTILSTASKAVFDRPRPPDAVLRVFTSSFPSGHATVSAVTYLTLGALLAYLSQDRRQGAFCLGVAIFITFIVGLSRIYLGVHYPTDVLAGWSLGAAWALLCWVVASLVGLQAHPK
ncbi:MAG: phosphatase PAP2 family protein [Devosia sp.]